MCVCLFLSTTNKQTRTVAVGLSLFLARGLGQEGREEVRQRAGNRASGGRCGGRGCCTRRVREFFSPPALIFAAAAGERPCALCLCLLSRGWNRTSSESGAALAAPSRRNRTVWSSIASEDSGGEGGRPLAETSTASTSIRLAASSLARSTPGSLPCVGLLLRLG